MTASTLQEATVLLEARTRTDYDIPPKWAWGSVASYVIWTAIPIIVYLDRGRSGTQLAIPLGILGLAGFLSSTLSSYLVYRLVNRRNTHFAREEAFLWKTLDTVKSKTPQTDMRTLLPLSSAEQGLAQLSETGREHSAILWALLTLIPYIGWVAMIYVLAFLSNDIRKHELREDLVLEDLGRVLKTQGGQDLPMRQRRVPNRSIPLHVLLSIATLCVFLLVWLYQLVKDPQAHFEYHRSFEEVLPGFQLGTGQSVGGPA